MRLRRVSVAVVTVTTAGAVVSAPATADTTPATADTVHAIALAISRITVTQATAWLDLFTTAHTFASQLTQATGAATNQAEC